MDIGNTRSMPLGGRTVPRAVHKRLEQTSAPTGDVVSLATLKAHLRVTHSDEDEYLRLLLAASIDAAEMYLNRKLLPRTVKMWMDYLPGLGFDYWTDGTIQAPASYTNYSSFRYFELMGTPVTAVANVKFVTDAGTTQTVAASNYIADFTDQDMPARIVLQRGSSWPTDLQVAHALQVEYTLGYATADAIPAAIKHGVLLMASALWSNRGDNQDATADVLQFSGVRAIFDPYRVLSLGGA